MGAAPAKGFGAPVGRELRIASATMAASIAMVLGTGAPDADGPGALELPQRGHGALAFAAS